MTGIADINQVRCLDTEFQTLKKELNEHAVLISLPKQTPYFTVPHTLFDLDEPAMANLGSMCAEYHIDTKDHNKTYLGFGYITQKTNGTKTCSQTEQARYYLKSALCPTGFYHDEATGWAWERINIGNHWALNNGNHWAFNSGNHWEFSNRNRRAFNNEKRLPLNDGNMSLEDCAKRSKRDTTSYGFTYDNLNPNEKGSCAVLRAGSYINRNDQGSGTNFTCIKAGKKPRY